MFFIFIICQQIANSFFSFLNFGSFEQVYSAIEGVERSLGLDPSDPIVPFVLLFGTSSTLWYWCCTPNFDICLWCGIPCFYRKFMLFIRYVQGCILAGQLQRLCWRLVSWIGFWALIRERKCCACRHQAWGKIMNFSSLFFFLCFLTKVINAINDGAVHKSNL